MPETLSFPVRPDGRPDGCGLVVAVLVASWHREVTERLEACALETLARSGVREEDVLVVPVAGCYELAQAAAWIGRAGMADAIVALGCLVRGETPHFDLIARATVDGCARAAAESGIPVGLGVITADTREQAEARSGPTGGPGEKGGNKGAEAADAAVRLALAYRLLEQRRRS
jgi:6,7-dimethyl-8-ribityllumazine synthase